MNKFNTIFNNFCTTLNEDVQLPATNDANNNQITSVNTPNNNRPTVDADFEVVDSKNMNTTNSVSDDELCEKIAKHQMRLLIKEYTSIEHIINIIKNAQALHNANETTSEDKNTDNSANNNNTNDTPDNNSDNTSNNEQLNKQSTELLSRIKTQLEELSNDSSDESK